jgi:L-threonylcarbamoyladenylate synthase
VYGLAVVPLEGPLQALIRLKGRPPEKGIVLLVDTADQIAGLVTVPAPAARLVAHFWPGPLTLVLPVRHGVALPRSLTGGQSTLGVRLPDHPVPRALAGRLGPLAVSSANRSGEPDATDADGLLTAVPGVDLVLDDGPVRGARPSSVVSVAADGCLAILRHGAIPDDAVWAVAGGPPGAGTLARTRRPAGDAP